jgi:anti-anti-sigma factor
MEIKKQTLGSVVILEPVGDMGLYNLGHLREALQELRESGSTNVLINMSRIPGIDSLSIGLLLLETGRFRNLGGALKLSKISPNVRKSFQITETLSQLEVYEDDKAALATFKGPKAT